MNCYPDANWYCILCCICDTHLCAMKAGSHFVWGMKLYLNSTLKLVLKSNYSFFKPIREVCLSLKNPPCFIRCDDNSQWGDSIHPPLFPFLVHINILHNSMWRMSRCIVIVMTMQWLHYTNLFNGISLMTE